VLDLALVNILERVVKVTEGERLGQSDHVVILPTVHVGSVKEEEKEPTLDRRRADWNSMREELIGTN
jgi:hypothetical protein